MLDWLLWGTNDCLSQVQPGPVQSPVAYDVGDLSGCIIALRQCTSSAETSALWNFQVLTHALGVVKGEAQASRVGMRLTSLPSEIS